MWSIPAETFHPSQDLLSPYLWLKHTPLIQLILRNHQLRSIHLGSLLAYVPVRYGDDVHYSAAVPTLLHCQHIPTHLQLDPLCDEAIDVGMATKHSWTCSTWVCPIRLHPLEDHWLTQRLLVHSQRRILLYCARSAAISRRNHQDHVSTGR